MAQIREELVLEDFFSATFANYLSYGEKAASTTAMAQKASQNYQSVLNSLDRRLISANAQFEAAVQEQERMVAAGKVNTDAFAMLDTRVEKLGSSIRDLTAQYQAVSKQAQAVSEATREMAEATQQATRAQEQQDNVTKKASGSTNGLSKMLSGVGKSNAFDSIGKQARRFALTIFSVSQILNFLKGSLERAPDSIQNSWNQMGQTIQDFLAGGVVAFLQKLQPAIDRFTAFMESDTGQKFARTLETAMAAAGEAVGMLLDGITWLAENVSSATSWMADSFDIVIVALGALAAVAVFAGAQMIVSAIQSAVAWAAALWPLFLIIGIIAAAILLARQFGATWEQIGAVVGGVFGALYAYAMNMFIIPVQNKFAAFANFLGNLMNDPVAAIKILFYDLAISALEQIRVMAQGLEDLVNLIPGVNVEFTSGLEGWISSLEANRENLKTASGWKEYVKPWEYVEFKDAVEDWSQKGAELGKGLDEFSLENVLAAPLKDISADTSAIRNSVSMAEEDIKSLVDIAERRYVNNINLTTKAPVINVQGQNTGNSLADTRAFMNTLTKMLSEQTASSSSLTTAQVF